MEPNPGETRRESEVTALVPARNEVNQIARTLSALAPQVDRVVLIDDNSVDGTLAVAQALGLPKLTIVAGAPLPAGWIGKVWALEQGLREVQTAWTLLLDADIELQPGAVGMLFRHQKKKDFDSVSVMQLLACNVLGKVARARFHLLFQTFIPVRAG